MKSKIMRIVARLTVVATIVSSLMGFSPASAATLTTAKDTLTREAISTTADHTVVFTLPTGVDFDSTTNTDILRVQFPSGFTLGGTWQTADFTFNDGTAHTVEAVAQGAGTIDCTVSTAQNVCVAVDTTNRIFSIKPAATYTASATAATITFKIFGTTTTGTGTLTNPGTAGNQALTYASCDETASCTTSFTSVHSTTVTVPIVDSDQVTVTASVAASLTFDLDTALTDTESAAPYSVPLGALTTGAVANSGTSINSIWVDVSTNAGGGVVVTVQNANGANGLVSTSTPADNINNAAATMAAGTENYGLCVISNTATTGTLNKGASYASGTCAADTQTNAVKALSSSTPDAILSSSGPLSGGRGRISVNAAISATTSAHSDYTDVLTFIATSTF
ncbi:MAG TPA: hypothetical protein VL426_05580 [Candidatus Binatia bacterium]|jgi:hypothetical protein|nr:hypothetical protein [Candidatus Binatia bacterium]